MQAGSRLGVWPAVAALVAGAPGLAVAATGTVQVFLSVEGEAPDWTSLDLTVEKLEVGGLDRATGKRFLVTAFEGARAVSIPRAAAGRARLLASGESVAGDVDRALVTLASASLTTDPTSPRVVPIVVQKKALKLEPPEPLALAEGGTRSLVATLVVGRDAVLTRSGTVALKPSLVAVDFTPTPESFLEGGETLVRGPDHAFGELGIVVSRSKAFDAEGGGVRDLVLRKSDGRPVSFAEARDADDVLWRTRHGALDPSLVRHLGPLPATETLTADVWLDVGAPGTPFASATVTPESRDLEHAAFVAARRAATSAGVTAVATAFADAGVTVLETWLDPPLLKVLATRAQLETVVARRAEVRLVAEAPPPSARAVQLSNAAVDIVQEPLFLAHLLGVGTGLRIAVTEDLACVNEAHEVFQGITFEPPVTGCSSSGTSAHNGHSTAVAGALAAFVPEPAPSNTRHPPAGLVGLFQGKIFTSTDCGLVAPETVARNPHLVNQSCIITQRPGAELQEWQRTWQRSVDHTVYMHRMFVVGGSGNEEPETIAATCPYYNALCVGGYAPAETYGPGQEADDYPTFRWKNDPATHREKPDLVAPSGGWFPHYQDSAQFPNAVYQQLGGTSFSAPFVTGTAALLMANFPQHVLHDPTLLRAVLLASARHGIPGQQRVPLHSDDIDDKVGAGAIRADLAREVLRDEQFYSRRVALESDFDADGDFVPPVEIELLRGERLRVALTWDQCQVDIVSSQDTLLADLDLMVHETEVGGPALGWYYANNSHVDNVELVEFAAQGGRSLVTLQVRAQHWSPCTDGSRSTFLSLAWHVLPPAGPVVGP